MPEIVDGQLVSDLPGPDALYDANSGAAQSLLPPPPPREVLFPSLVLPWEQERLAFRKRLYDQYGLTYGLSYQQLTQYATQTRPGVRQNWATGGWAGVSITWTPIDRDGPYQGSLVASAGWRGPVGQNPWPTVFGPAYVGMNWTNYTYTSWKSRFEVENLFWEQRIGTDLNVRIGNIGAAALINTFRFKDDRTSFTASPVASSFDTIPYNAFAAGAGFRWRPQQLPGVFVNGVVASTNGNPSQGSLNWQHLQWNQLFAGLEIGKQWPHGNGEYDQIAINVFHAGTRSIFNPTTTPNAAGGGFKILGEKQWGPIVAFASYTYNTAKGGGTSLTLSGNVATAGVAYLRPFGIRGEVAIAAIWAQPIKNIFPGSGQRDQYGIDTYWNVALSQNITFSPGIQLIQHPAFSAKADFVAIPSFKFRVAY